jgi:tRNA modification GTPase
VRMSGADAIRIAQEIAPDFPSQPRTPIRRLIRIGSFEIPGWVYAFHSPRSYTGEDLVEFHIPGNVLLSRRLVEDLIQRGARAAEPGEFTARAYFNARMDLTEAEGVAAMVSSLNENELRAARQLLSGELARRLRPVMDSVAETLGLIEVGIDFSEEDVTFLSQGETLARIEQADNDLGKILAESASLERLAHEPVVVLAGRPNAGKSTLLNALAGHDRAVVSPIAGTTRDVLSAEVNLPRGIIRIIDVAGVEETHISSTGAHADIDREMRTRALRAVEEADVVVLVRDITDPRENVPLPRDPDLIVHTKADLQQDHAELLVSAKTGLGLDHLRHRLDALSFGAETSSTIALNARHRLAIGTARASLSAAREQANTGGLELIALGLREALDSLSEILGTISPDDVLGRIFAKFCIGK